MSKVPCEVYSRVCGFFRPVKEWNRGKKSEYADRKVYSLPEAGYGSGRPVQGQDR